MGVELKANARSDGSVALEIWRDGRRSASVLYPEGEIEKVIAGLMKAAVDAANLREGAGKPYTRPARPFPVVADIAIGLEQSQSDKRLRSLVLYLGSALVGLALPQETLFRLQALLSELDAPPGGPVH